MLVFKDSTNYRKRVLECSAYVAISVQIFRHLCKNAIKMLICLHWVKLFHFCVYQWNWIIFELVEVCVYPSFNARAGMNIFLQNKFHQCRYCRIDKNFKVFLTKPFHMIHGNWTKPTPVTLAMDLERYYSIPFSSEASSWSDSTELHPCCALKRSLVDPLSTFLVKSGYVAVTEDYSMRKRGEVGCSFRCVVE